MTHLLRRRLVPATAVLLAVSGLQLTASVLTPSSAAAHTPTGATAALTAAGPGAASSRVARRAGLAPVPARTAASFVSSVGVCIHSAYGDTPYGSTDRVIKALKGLHVSHVRDDLLLDNTYEYANIRRIAQSGIDFDLIAGRPGNGVTAKAYVDTMRSQLPLKDVDAIEGPNEWDIFGGQNWAPTLRAYQKQLFGTVRATPALKGIPVVAPSMAFRDNYAQLGRLPDTSNVANSHDYTGGRVPTYQLSQLLPQVRSMAGNTHTFVTETGYHNAMNTTDGHRPVPENVSAAYLPRTLLGNYAHHVNRTYLYELIDERDEGDLTDPEANFGLLHHDWSPKPAYTAIKRLMALATRGHSASPAPLRNLDYRIEDAPSDLQQVLLQQPDGSYLLVLWRDQSIYNPDTQRYLSAPSAPVKVALPGASSMSVYRPNSGAAAVRTVDSASMSIPVDARITALHISAPSGTSDAPAAPSAPATPGGGHATHATGHNAGHAAGVHGLRASLRDHHVFLHWAARRGVSAYRVRVGHEQRRLAGSRDHATVWVPRGRRHVLVSVRSRVGDRWSAPVTRRVRPVRSR